MKKNQKIKSASFSEAGSCWQFFDENGDCVGEIWEASDPEEAAFGHYAVNWAKNEKIEEEMKEKIFEMDRRKKTSYEW